MEEAAIRLEAGIESGFQRAVLRLTRRIFYRPRLPDDNALIPIAESPTAMIKLRRHPGNAGLMPIGRRISLKDGAGLRPEIIERPDRTPQLAVGEAAIVRRGEGA